MGKKKKITRGLISVLVLLVVVVTTAYIYAIQGEKLDDSDFSWITTVPIAHRGLDNGDVHENSMEAFKKAIESGYAIELDVQLTKDKEVIVFHDSNLLRMTGDSRDVKDVEYDEIKSLKLENTEETIPTLKEVLELVDNQVPILIELKDEKEATDLAAKTYEVVENYEGRYLVQSFNPFTLEWFKNNASEVIRCQLSSDFTDDPNNTLEWYEVFVLKNLLLNFKSKPHVIAYDLNSVDNLSVGLLKAKYPILSWTIANEEHMHMGYKKTDNIIFDNILP